MRLKQKQQFAAYVARERQRKAETAAAALRNLETAKPAETVADVLVAYIDRLRILGKPSLGDVQSAVECWIGPALGGLAPADCTPNAVRALVDAMLAVGLKESTVRTKASFVRSAMVFGCAKGLVAANPLPTLAGVVPPKRTYVNADREVMPPALLARLVSSALIPLRDRVMYLVMAMTGVREAEAFALRLEDINRDAPVRAALHVERQWSRKRHQLCLPKGGRPRAVPVRADVAAWLDRWIEVGWRRLVGGRPGPGDLLFPEPREDRLGYLNDRTVLKRFKKQLNLLGIAQRRMHAFRHTFVSNLVNAGVSTDVIERCTHVPSGARTINTYAHFSWPVLCEAVERVNLNLAEPTDIQGELFGADAYRRK